MSHSEINIVKKISEWIDVEQFNKCKIMKCDAYCFIAESSIEQLDECDRRTTDLNGKLCCKFNAFDSFTFVSFSTYCCFSCFWFCHYYCCYYVVFSRKHLFSVGSELSYCVLLSGNARFIQFKMLLLMYGCVFVCLCLLWIQWGFLGPHIVWIIRAPTSFSHSLVLSNMLLFQNYKIFNGTAVPPFIFAAMTSNNLQSTQW